MNARPAVLQRAVEREPTLVRLARLLAVAVRVEPALIRQMRLACLPGSDVGLESDLWWSGLVQTRDPVALAFRPDVLEVLRDELRQARFEAELELAWPTIEAAHRLAPPVVRLEEHVTYLALRGDIHGLERYLGGAVDALVADESGKLSRWVLRALSRFPHEARTSEAALLLASLASERLGGVAVPGVVQSEGGTSHAWSPDLLRKLPKVAISLRLSAGRAASLELDGQLELGTWSTPHGTEASLSLPATSPLIVDVLTPTAEGWTERRFEIGKAPVQVDLRMGPAVKVRSLLGDELLLRPHLPNHRPIVALPRVRPGAARIWISDLLADLGWEVSTEASARGATAANPETEAFLSELIGSKGDPRMEQQRGAIRRHLLERDRQQFSSWLEQSAARSSSGAPLHERRLTHFVLWRPSHTTTPPYVLLSAIGANSDPPQRLELKPAHGVAGVWELAAGVCLAEDQAYRYWFEVEDTYESFSETSTRPAPTRWVSDPFAWTIDRRFLEGGQPASVIKLSGQQLVTCDVDGKTARSVSVDVVRNAIAQARLVTYHIPIGRERVGAERAMKLEQIADLVGFPDRDGPAHLTTLGVNALQLRAFDAQMQSAPHAALGDPSGLATLIDACHSRRIHVLAEVGLDSWSNSPYRHIAFGEFLMAAGGDRDERAGFTYDLPDYEHAQQAYDPLTGEQLSLVPARQLMLSHLRRWVEHFRIDGISLEAFQSVASRDFLKDVRAEVRQSRHTRGPGEAAIADWLVLGQDRGSGQDLDVVDAVWNEDFKLAIRALILGRTPPGEDDFASAVRELIASNATTPEEAWRRINFLGSSLVGGFGNERIAHFVKLNGVQEPAARLKLAFACLLTAVGMPLILAGDEYGSESTLTDTDDVAWFEFDVGAAIRQAALVTCVSRLVHLRTQHDALAGSDVQFIHFDFDGKRVMAWLRGSVDDPVIVVANFSGWSAEHEYVIPAWPRAQRRVWREVTEDRLVPSAWAGREPIAAWEAKVYVCAEGEPWRRFNGHNVLVAGTGHYRLDPAELWASTALGTALAGAGFGLVTGGWRGVDHVIADSYDKEARRLDGVGGGHLLQVVEAGHASDFAGGEVKAVPAADVYDEAIASCSAVVLIGGRGGTLEVYRRAQARGIPIFPIQATGGDAERAFRELTLAQHPYLERASATLSARLTSLEDAAALSERLVALLSSVLITA